MLISISSDGPRDHCYIETSSLDGESNLKLRTACFTAERHAADHAACNRNIQHNNVETEHIIAGNIPYGVPLPGFFLRTTTVLHMAHNSRAAVGDLATRLLA